MHYHYFTLEQRAILENLIRALPSEPERSSALSRLREPDYGVCIKCGQDITFARLSADPSALYCQACASLRVRDQPSP